MPLSSSIHDPISLFGNSQIAAFCSGNDSDGSFEKPYVLKDYIIDAAWSSSGIYLSNIDKFVIIKNCTITHSSANFGINAAIRLENCKNIMIQQNNLSSNLGNGVTIWDNSKNILIEDNYIYNNSYQGIFLRYANDSIFRRNYIENVTNGIMLNNDPNNITVVDNLINCTSASGVYIRPTASRINVINNTIVNTTYQGIDLDTADNNMVCNNTIWNSKMNGLYVSSCNNTIFCNNTIKNSGFDAITVQLMSDRNSFINNTLHNNRGGLIIYEGSNITIFGNKIFNNTQNGFSTNMGNNYTIINNEIYNNSQHGVYISGVSNNTIIGNMIYNNTFLGMSIQNSNGSQIIGNVICQNQWGGLSILSAANNCSFYLNIFTNNSINEVNDQSEGNNIWNNTEMDPRSISGNYYGDYRAKYGSASNNGEIWDTPYSITPGVETDYSPLVNNFAITHPKDINMTAGDIGCEINWSIVEVLPNDPYYLIYRNNTAIIQGNWTLGLPIRCLLDGLAPGLYNYSIVANNGRGRLIQDTVWVNVSVPDVPFIESPMDMSFEVGSSNKNITWRVWDISVNNPAYTIYCNGELNSSGSWASGSPIIVELNDLPKGSYIFRIVASDGFGNEVQDEVNVEVSPATLPENHLPQVNHPTDNEYIFGTTGHKIVWLVIDPDVHSPTYEVLLNNSHYSGGIWNSGDPIEIEIDGLAIGDHNFTIIVDDGLGGIDIDEVIITVTESAIDIRPYIISLFIATIGIIFFFKWRKTKKRNNK